jgi:hypothetical protein
MEEIRAAVEINGKCNTKTRSEWSYTEITERESAVHFY